jgi:LysR family nitrogen assimilation transcriptional regulator
MELRQLEYFLAVTASGSLSRASTVLGIAQPALSRSVRHLEEIVGTQLFYRHGRGIRLTEKGTEFRTAIEPSVRHLLEAKDALKSTVNMPAGSISIGMPPSVSAAVGSRIVEIFLRHYPRVKLRLVDGFSGYINEWLVSGRLDMAVINGARRSAHVRMDPLLTVDLFHVAHRDMVEAGERNDSTISLDRLLSSPLILPGPHHGLRRQLDAAARGSGAKLRVIIEIDALEALKDLVRRGIGPTVLPHGAILKEIGDTQLIVRRLASPDVTMQFMIAYSLQKQTTLAMRELARILRLEVRKAVSEGRLMGRV